MSAHDFEFTAIDGQPLPLADWDGKAVLVVNTASECEFTPQYEALQTLWQQYRGRGLVVLGVPSNDFGDQEPGSEADIKRFCEATYRTDFPLTAKVKVIGGDAHPLFRWIESEFGEALAPRWNFHKYLIAPDGTLAGAWPSRVEPGSAEIATAIEENLPD
jgi:glutathione peroxidase